MADHIFRHRVDDHSDEFSTTSLNSERWLNFGSPAYTIVTGKLRVTVGAGTDYARLENRVPLPRSSAYTVP